MQYRLLTTTHLTAPAYNNDTGTEFTTCLGRIVWGHPLKPQNKTKDNQPVLDDNGQPVKQWAFGVAFPKAEFEAQMWPHFAAEAAKMYPNGAPRNFTYKYKDGDTDLDRNNNPLSAKDGYAGCYIVSFSTELQPPQCYVYQNNAYKQIDENALKTGDYVQVGTNIKVHAGQTPGLYVNPMTVLLCFEGDAISGGYTADPNATFGAAPPQVQMPAGARAVGAAAPAQAAPAGSMPGMGNAPAGAAPVTQAPLMANAGTAAPGANATTMPGQSAPGGMPGAGGMPAAPPAGNTAPQQPVRPTDPAHIHDNGNGTEQWFDPATGAWDGGAHPVPTAAPATPPAPGQLPPPATGIIDQAAAGAPTMPGAPPPR